MRDRSWTALLMLACSVSPGGALLACGDDSGAEDTTADTGPQETDGDTTAGTDETDTGGEGLEATVTHDFGEITLDPFEEIENCVQWTLDNDEAVYVQEVTLANLGYFHHSNWFVVPEDIYPGDDGFFNCGSRDFTELGAASYGTVLFAQSTQSFVEHQRTADGAVVKIPPRHKVIGGTHLLNVGPSTISSQLFMSLDIIHPKLVEVVLTPFRLSYLDLDIPANAESRFTGACDDFGARYQAATSVPIDMKLHYALPHYHYLGNYFALEFTGGGFDGQKIYEHNGFDGAANGLTFDPPLSLAGVEGIRYTCGYDNWRDVNVGWGVGDQEMCVMLALAESRILMDISVTGGTKAVGEENGILEFEGPCGILAVAKNPAQSPPSDDERNAPLYVPPSGEEGLPPVPACTDHDPAVQPVIEPTLSNVAAVIFQQSCMFNACHGESGQAAGLNLQAPDLLTELLNHEVVGNVGATLVEPGDPDSSWLYQIVADCTPEGGSGNHMPLNAPVLLDDRSIALIREWIAAGAMNN